MFILKGDGTFPQNNFFVKIRFRTKENGNGFGPTFIFQELIFSIRVDNVDGEWGQGLQLIKNTRLPRGLRGGRDGAEEGW